MYIFSWKNKISDNHFTVFILLQYWLIGLANVGFISKLKCHSPKVYVAVRQQFVDAMRDPSLFFPDAQVCLRSFSNMVGVGGKDNKINFPPWKGLYKGQRWQLRWEKMLRNAPCDIFPSRTQQQRSCRVIFEMLVRHNSMLINAFSVTVRVS